MSPRPESERSHISMMMGEESMDVVDLVKPRSTRSDFSSGSTETVSDHEGDGKKNERNGRSQRRNPPRPTRSASMGRNHKSSSSRRTTRRVLAAEKQWGQSSSRGITVRDLMGSEKKATAVGIVHGSHSKRDSTSVKKGDASAKAEQKRSMIRDRQKEKQSRQDRIRNAVSLLLVDEEEGDEDEDIISDADDEVYWPTSARSLGRAEALDEEAKNSSKNQRRRKESSKRHCEKGDANDSSNHSRTKSCRRVKPSLKSSGDKDDGGSTRSRSKSARQSKRKSRSHSTKRRPSSSKQLGSSRRKPAEDEDDRSVGSKKSLGGRRRRHQQPSRSKESPNPPASITVDPETPAKSKKSGDLCKHIEAGPKASSTGLGDDESDGSSRYTVTYNRPSSLLQFDPSNANSFTLVKQDSKAIVTSERIKNAGGEMELEISKLKGLPTFENRPVRGDIDDNYTKPQSARSMGSFDSVSDDLVHKTASLSVGNLGFLTTPKERTNNPGENQSGQKGRGVAKTFSAGAPRPFLGRRAKKPENSRKPTAHPSNAFHNSMKGIFNAFNRSGECDLVGDDGDQGGSRFFSRRQELEHQALDDDGSDED